MRKNIIAVLMGLSVVSVLSIPSALAGGSSMLIQVTGGEFTAQPGGTLSQAMVLHIESYFPAAIPITDTLLDGVTVQCVGDPVVTSAELKEGSKKIASAAFTSMKSILTPPHHVLRNNTKHDFDIVLHLKKNILKAGTVHCGVHNVLINNPDKNAEEPMIYDEMGAYGSGYPDMTQNDSAMISVSNAQGRFERRDIRLTWFTQNQDIKTLGSGMVFGELIKNPYDIPEYPYILQVRAFDPHFKIIMPLLQSQQKDHKPIPFNLALDASLAKKWINTPHWFRVRDLHLFFNGTASLAAPAPWAWGTMTAVRQ